MHYEQPPQKYKGFEARYKGLCQICDKPIHIGQTIVPFAGHTYAHYRCMNGKPSKFKESKIGHGRL